VRSGFEKQAPVQFDPGFIPVGSTVESARFGAVVFSTGTQTIRAHRITAPWSESEVTWSRFAASYDPAVEATLGGTAAGVQTTDLTALVQAWVDGASPNHGLLLEEDAAARTGYRSSETSHQTERPWLEVCYLP
jgi:hypothetical protein